MLAQIAQWSLIVFGYFVVMGGIIGWKKAKSKASLISAVVADSLLIGAFVVCLAYNLSIGLLAGTIVCLLLAIVFMIRFYKTKKFMPSGMLLVLSALETILLAAGYKSLS